MGGSGLLLRKRPLNPISLVANSCFDGELKANLAWSQAWGRQCGDAISLQELLDQRLHGRSRRARSRPSARRIACS